MIDVRSSLLALTVIVGLAVLGWLLSLFKRDVSVVDGLWSMFFLIGAVAYAVTAGAQGTRSTLVLTLTALWAVRLAGYLTWRNWGESEDRRYQAIRARNEPGFPLKSLFLVFGLQAVLAWIIAVPLFGALSRSAPLNIVDYAGAFLWLCGFTFEVVADWQLARFKADPGNRGKVLDKGLWCYSRHPNYFGEAALWWGYFLIAVAAGASWTLFSPVLMTFLLLKVSGVALLERDIGERRPAYRDYVARTSAFFPWIPRDTGITPRRSGMTP